MSGKESLWTPIGDKEIQEWRKRPLPKDWTREYNTARHSEWDEVASDGDTVEVQAEEAPSGEKFIHPALEREVAQEVYGMIWNWARKNPEAYQLAIQIMKHNNPEAFGHMSNDELQTQLEQHAKDAARQVTKQVYEKNKEERRWGASH